MATAPLPLSIDEYLTTSYKPDAHYVDGHLEDRSAGTYEHGKLQGLLAMAFTLNAREWSTDPVVAQRIRVRSHQVRVCDVAVLRADAPREAVTTTPPLICIEILSPDDRLSRTKLVLADYLAMGVEQIWLIDPIYRAAFTYSTAGLQEADSTALTIPGTPISVDLTAAFAALD
jgi:Uma2 family endonuclease